MARSGEAPKSKPPQRGHARARTDAWHALFFGELALTLNIAHSAKAAGVDVGTIYKRRASDPEFAAAMVVALDHAIYKAEAELYRRAVTGTEKPLTVAREREIIREYPDPLLLGLLKAHRSDKDREKQEITGKDGGPVTIRVVYDEPKEEPNAESR